MKRLISIFSFFTPLFVSLFLFIPQVKADTLNLTFNESQLDLLSTSYFISAKQFAENQLLSNSSYNSYLIRENNSSYLELFLYKGISSCSFDYSSNTLSGKIYFPEKSNYRCNHNGTCDYYGRELNAYNSIPIPITNNSINLKYFAYFYTSSNVECLYSNSSTDISITSDNYYNLISYNDPFPTLADVKYYIDNPPTPTDNFPLLTSFVNICIDKFDLMTDFFTSSYVYLTIFVVFIIYFVIYLFRRFL